MSKPNERFRREYIPIELWGRDHWSLLAYIETVVVDCARMTIYRNPRMRHNRRHFRVMPCGKDSIQAVVMGSDHGTRLNDGSYVPSHDDWNCVQDMAEAGMLSCGVDQIEPGNTFRLSDKGLDLAGQIRRHKANGKPFSTFKPELTKLTTPN